MVVGCPVMYALLFLALLLRGSNEQVINDASSWGSDWRKLMDQPDEVREEQTENSTSPMFATVSKTPEPGFPDTSRKEMTQDESKRFSSGYQSSYRSFHECKSFCQKIYSSYNKTDDFLFRNQSVIDLC